MTTFLKKYQPHILSILVVFTLFLGYNWKLVSNISTALSDWYDYPLMVYIQQQNIEHLSQLDFANFGNTSMYYNSPGGMYFTDLLLPQSIFGLFLYPLFENYITTHNVVFIIVGLLNIISLQYFWSKVFKDNTVIFALTLLFTFSPYTFSMYAHYQMISYWFFFFALGKLISANKPSDYFWSGVLIGLQFLAAVYIGMYALAAAGLFFLWQLISPIKLNLSNFKKPKQMAAQLYSELKRVMALKYLLPIIKHGLVFSFGFVLIAGYFAYHFAHVKKIYNITRPADEYVNHSMQITDFLFNPLPSVWVENVYKYVNVNNHRLGGETFGTGFVLMGSIFYGMYRFSKSKLSKSQKYIAGFIILLGIWGFIAILGPRLSINGKYLAIPLPYILPLKLTPVFDALRVISRWFFVLQIAFLYFVGFGLNHMISHWPRKKMFAVITLIVVLYIVEIVPIRQRTAIDSYQSYSYNTLIENCTQQQVLLEYPFAPQQPKTHVLITLSYWVKMLLNNMHYDCQLVNGYSGFQPKHIDDFVHYFRLAVEAENTAEIQSLLKQKDVTYIKFNKEFMVEESITSTTQLFESEQFTQILNDDLYLIVKVR